MKGLNPGRVLGGGICAGVLLALGETFLNQTVLAKESTTLSMGQTAASARKALSSRAAGVGSGVGSCRQRHFCSPRATSLRPRRRSTSPMLQRLRR